MLEWRVRDESGSDVYYEGRKIEKWAGKEFAEELYKTLRYENELEMQLSLLKTIDLFIKESHYLAARYDYPLNPKFENFVKAFIKNTAIPFCENHHKELVN